MPSSIALRVSASNAAVVNFAPGLMPSLASRAMTGASASRAGLFTSSSQSRPKNCSADSLNTCTGTGVLASTPGLTGTLAGGV